MDKGYTMRYGARAWCNEWPTSRCLRSGRDARRGPAPATTRRVRAHRSAIDHALPLSRRFRPVFLDRAE